MREREKTFSNQRAKGKPRNVTETADMQMG